MVNNKSEKYHEIKFTKQWMKIEYLDCLSNDLFFPNPNPMFLFASEVSNNLVSVFERASATQTAVALLCKNEIGNGFELRCQGSDSLLISEVQTNKNSSEASGSFNYNLFHSWVLT